MLNYLRVTIRKIRVIKEKNIQNFNLKLDLFKQVRELEKLSLGETEINQVILFLKLEFFLGYFKQFETRLLRINSYF